MVPVAVWVAAPMVASALLRAPPADIARVSQDPRLRGDLTRGRLALAKWVTLAVGLVAAAAVGVLPFP